ncbi:MAG: outer membrane protein [Vicinamibacterales bacterium]
MTNRAKFMSSCCVCAFMLCGVSAVSSAQEVEAGQTEILGFVGGVTDGGGTTVGGGVQYAFNPRLLLALEVGYLTLGDDFSGFGVDADSSGLSVDANVHYLFPAAASGKLTPYLLGGLGVLRASVSVSSPGFGGGDASDSTLGVNVGGGARWQAGENWGIRPELKVFIEESSNVRFSVAFYRAFN